MSTSETQSAYFGIGRRKNSVAKVIIVPGSGSLVVNHKPGELYLQFNAQYIDATKSPLITLGLEKAYDIYVNAHGGGLKGQADAIKLGIARALCYMSADNKTTLKAQALLTRDAKCKERKKYGLRKARKAPQYSKR